jgi:VIT1/CCC1 family predicted Fe2+/Mn2+ transporter|tara:strand:+ start:288 stop:473 length:186 start_codon:yes stop_codon:yes gene_type:complete
MPHLEQHKSHRIGWLRAAVLGALSARAGGASMAKGALRVGFWGALAMLVTAQIGQFFGVAA